MTRPFAFMGKFALFIAGMAALTLVFLFIGGAYLTTLPLMRLSPRNRRLTALMGAGTAVVTLARAYGLGTIPEPATEATEATEALHRCQSCRLIVGPLPDGDIGLHEPGCREADDWRGPGWEVKDFGADTHGSYVTIGEHRYYRMEGGD